MATRGRRAVRIRQRKRARLRLVVLRLGGLLGWGPRDVIGFAEALTGRPWRQCGRADLEAVRDEFLALRWAIRRKAARRSCAVRLPSASSADGLRPCCSTLGVDRAPLPRPSWSRSSRRARTRRSSPRPRICWRRSRSPSRSAWRSPPPRRRDDSWPAPAASPMRQHLEDQLGGRLSAGGASPARRRTVSRPRPGLAPPGRASVGLHVRPARPAVPAAPHVPRSATSWPIAPPRPTPSSGSWGRSATCRPAGGR